MNLLMRSLFAFSPVTDADEPRFLPGASVEPRRAQSRCAIVRRMPRRLDPERAVEHLPRLYRAARAWTRSREEADDLVQETYARVLSRPRLIRGEDDLGYLLRALRNTLTSQRRSEGRRPVTTELADESPLGTRSSDDPAEELQTRQVFAAIAALPDDFRDALVAVDVAGLSYPEAAHALGVPEGTLTSRLFRARDRVARLLSDRTD
jgi:RNA polymerase sigma-70 factor, ECF subfamily